MTNLNTIIEEEKKWNELHRLDGECAECGGTGEGADNPCSDNGETYPCYLCKGTGIWHVYRQKDVDEHTTIAMQRAYEAGQQERDTYWKERVRKEVEELKKQEEFETGDFSRGMEDGYERVQSIIKDITNEDNNEEV